MGAAETFLILLLLIIIITIMYTLLSSLQNKTE